MNILDAIGKALSPVTAIFQPITELISKVVPSGDARLQLQAKVLDAQIQSAQALMAYQQQLLDAQKSIIVAEAQGASWIQRNWRPITALTFVSLVAARWLGFSAPGLSEALEMKLFDIIEVMIGGYVGGRTVEKVVPAITNAIAAAKK